MPDGYPKDASNQPEPDEQFINELVAELRVVCRLNTSPGAKPKLIDTKSDPIYKCAFCNYL